MKELHSFKSFVAMCVYSGMVFLAGGCNAYLPGPSYVDMKIPQEKFRQIETLELPEAEPEETPMVDAKEAPPEKLELSLEECRALALQNDLKLKADLMSPTIAAEHLSEAEAKFEASFFANGNLDKSEVPGGTLIEVAPGVFVPAIAASKSETSFADIGIQAPLHTGGSVTLDVADTRIKDLDGGPLFNPSYRNQFSVSISQPLLRNAGKWANMHSIRVAGYSRQMIDARAKLEVIVVLATVDRVYWRLYTAHKELQVRRQQYDLAQVQLERAQRLVDLGERPQVEIIRAEAGVTQQLEAIVIAENNLRYRSRELKRVINKPDLDMRTSTVLVPLTEPDPIRYDTDRSQLVRLAMDSRMELLELQVQLLQDASNVDYARNQALPLASLGYTYNIAATDDSRNGAFDSLYSSEFTGHRLNAQMVIPIGNQAAKSRIRQAIYQRRQRLASRNDREAMIEWEVLNAIDQADANWQRIMATRQNSILNGRLYEAEKSQFDLGIRTSTDVVDAQTIFANAQIAEIIALAEYQIALVDLAHATGTILGAARIQWAPIIPADVPS